MVPQNQPRQESTVEQFQNQDCDEEQGVGVVLEHHIGVDYWMQQNFLVLLERLQSLDTKCFILIVVLSTQSNDGRHIQTYHEFVRVLVFSIGADVVIQEMSSKI